MNVNIIYDCNEWHAPSSFRFIAVVDDEHLERILKEIKDDYEYTDKDMEWFIHIDKAVLNEWR